VTAPEVRTTQAFLRWRRGEPGALDEILPSVYEELRRLAAANMRLERPGHTLQPTALAHEAYLRLVSSPGLAIQDRSHFMVLAARAMRRVLADHARRRQAVKRGEDPVKVTLTDLAETPSAVDAEELTAALDALARLDERQAHIVELRFFGGLTVEEVADVLGVSAGTVKRDWTLARAWLHRELSEEA
jgi:RNA polymerase sigma factor (TIGR02999 family)